MRLLMLLAVAAVVQGCGASLLRTSCDKPRVSNFGVPSSYIVMLPFRYGGQDKANAELALQLNQIARLQALQAAVEMPATQITLVEGDPADRQCDIENVYDRVVENPSGLFWRRPFHSAIFVWGEIFDRDDGFAVQSHLRVFWNGSADRELEVSVDSPALVRPLRFGGDLPADTMSFPAQTITRAAQQQLARSIATGLKLYTAPRLDAPPAELPTKFSAVAWNPPWLELQDRQRQSVWLLIEGGGLHSGPAFPETLFARAMASYLNFRVNGDDTSRKQVLESLKQFRQAMSQMGERPPRVPLAMAAVIEGTLGLPTAAYDSPMAASNATVMATQTIPLQAQSSLADAARRLPSNGEVLNLAAISRIPGCCDGSDAPARIREIHNMLVRADALERGNRKIAGNLLNWYRYLATLPDAKLPFTRAELTEWTRQAARSLDAWSALRGR